MAPQRQGSTFHDCPARRLDDRRSARRAHRGGKVRLLTGRDFWSTWPITKIGLRRILFSDGPSGVRDEQELSVLCLRILQAALVCVNTLMVQDVLADQAWADRLTAEDRRGLTPLFWAHVASYGEVRLDMGRRLSLHGALPAAPPEAR